jgi:hypothetical protein
MEDVPRVFGLLESRPRMDWTIVCDSVHRGYERQQNFVDFFVAEEADATIPLQPIWTVPLTML